MSWKSLNPEEPKTVYQSNATDVKGVAKDIHIVVSKMIENRESDNAFDAKQLVFVINSTNGYMTINWCQSKPKKNVGDWVYSLELQDFWKNSKDFERRCYYSILSYVGDYLYDENKQSPYDIYMRTDIGRAKRLVKRAKT